MRTVAKSGKDMNRFVCVFLSLWWFIGVFTGTNWEPFFTTGIRAHAHTMPCHGVPPPQKGNGRSLPLLSRYLVLGSSLLELTYIGSPSAHPYSG